MTLLLSLLLLSAPASATIIGQDAEIAIEDCSDGALETYSGSAGYGWVPTAVECIEPGRPYACCIIAGTNLGCELDEAYQCDDGSIKVSVPNAEQKAAWGARRDLPDGEHGRPWAQAAFDFTPDPPGSYGVYVADGNYCYLIVVEMFSASIESLKFYKASRQLTGSCGRIVTNEYDIIASQSLDGAPFQSLQGIAVRWIQNDLGGTCTIKPLVYLFKSAAERNSWDFEGLNGTELLVSQQACLNLSDDFEIGWHIEEFFVGQSISDVSLRWFAYGDAQVDTDGDGAKNQTDNCALRRNVTQCDSDADGYGNYCDSDYDGDGFVGITPDFQQFRAAFDLGVSPPASQHPDADCDGVIGINPDNAIFLDGFTAGVPGLSGYACAGSVPCP